jgi:hypothetical protein
VASKLAQPNLVGGSAGDRSQATQHTMRRRDGDNKACRLLTASSGPDDVSEDMPFTDGEFPSLLMDRCQDGR